MKKLILILGVCFLISCCSVYSQTSEVIVLKSSDLEFISLTRLSDIYSILPQLDLYTTDGYRHSSLYGSLFNNAPQNIIVLINGVQTSFGVWEKANLSQFPVHPNSIDSIVIKYLPTIYLGEYSSGILIDIITKKPPEDLSLIFTYATGNETGDPGPYRYTEYFSDNVDQFGPNTLITSSYGSERFNLTFSFIDQVSPTTDPAILKRVDDFVFQNYQVRYSGFSLNASALSGFGKHNLFAAYTKTGQAVVGFEYGADLIFIDALSTETPYENESFLFSSGNEIQIDNNKKLNVNLNLSYTNAEQSKFSEDLTFNSEDLLLHSKISYKFSAETFGYGISSSFSYQNFQPRFSNSSISRNIPSFFAFINFHTLKNLQHNIDFIYRADNNSSGLFFVIANKYKINEANCFSLSLKKGNLFNNIGYSTNQGGINAFGTALVLAYNYKHSQNTSVDAGINFISRSNLTYFLRDFIYNEPGRYIDNLQTQIHGSVKGIEGEYYLSIYNRLFRNLEHKLYYRYKSSLSGDEIFKQIVARIPQNKIFYSIYYSPFSDLKGSLTLSYSSLQKWLEYRNIDTKDGLYVSELKDNLLINLSITKKFWDGKIKLSGMINNLLNNRIQHHPVGGTFDLTFFLKAEAELESVFKF
ncbi:MAG TPA: hypothetical protein VK870_10050 [Ignavibacteriaceae bacterium]|nr:hypothetical protein [Ignavibacteriaceae bacterium]